MADTIRQRVESDPMALDLPFRPRARPSPASSSSSGCTASRPARNDRDDARLVVSELVGNAVRHARPLADGTMQVAWGRGRPASTSPSPTAAPAPPRSGSTPACPTSPAAAWPSWRPSPTAGGSSPPARAPPCTRCSAWPEPTSRRPATLVFGAWERSHASATARPRRPRHPQPRAPSARASPAPAARAAATRRATAARAGPGGLRRPALRGTGQRGRRRRPAGVRPRRHRTPPPHRLRPHGPALLAAPGRGAGAGARGRHHLAGAPGAARVRRPQPRPRRRAPPGAGRRAGQHGRAGRAAR